MRALRWYFLVPLAYCGVAVAMLWPLVTHLTSAVADTEGDPLLNAWALRWDQHALRTRPLHMYDANQFAPNLHALAFSDALFPQALVAWPVWLFTHDVLVTHNVMVLLTYPVCAIAMYALCRGFGAVRGAAFLGGLCYMLAPMRLDENAHLQVLSIQWMPLALLALVRFVQRPTLLRGIAITLACAACALSSAYYAVIFGTGATVFILVEAMRFRRHLRTRTGIAAVVALTTALIVVVVVNRPYFAMQHEQGITRTLDEAYDNSAHLSSYLTVVPGSIIWQHLLPTSRPGYGALFPGAVLIGLALVGLGAMRRQWLLGLGLLGVVGFVLSFGPTWGAKTTGLPLPYRLLYAHVPGFAAIRGPARFATLPLLALCVLAALGGTRIAARLRGRLLTATHSGLLLTLIATGAILLDDGARLLPTIPVDRSPETLAPYQWLATQPDRGIVAEFPVSTMATRTAFYSTYHWHPVLWGHSGLIPEAQYELQKRLVGQGDYVGPGDLAALADFGVETILIHQSAYTPEMYTRIRMQLAKVPNRLPFIAHIGDCDIYRLAIVPHASAPSLTARFSTVAIPTDGELYGEVRLHNSDTDNRMLYVVGRPALMVMIRDLHGTIVTTVPVPTPVPALLPPGDASVLFSVAIHLPAGSYRATLKVENLPAFQPQDATPLQVVPVPSAPRLTVRLHEISSPAVFAPNEAVAMWVTQRNQANVSLTDVRANGDGSLSVHVGDYPPDAIRLVAYGRDTGAALWAALP